MCPVFVTLTAYLFNSIEDILINMQLPPITVTVKLKITYSFE